MGRKKSRREGGAAALKRLFGRRAPGGGVRADRGPKPGVERAVSWGRPMRMGAYSRSAGVWFQRGHPLNRGTVVRTPDARRCPILDLSWRSSPRPPQRRRRPKLTVMTRNVYLGGNIAGPIPATDRADFERRTSALWAAVHTTNFPARAKLLAREVKRTKPDLIGLQEVALWRRGPDGVQDGSATPATTPVYDFLALARVGSSARGSATASPPLQPRGRPRGADQPRLRRAADDARRRAHAHAQGPARSATGSARNYKAVLRGADRRSARCASRRGWTGDRRRAATASASASSTTHLEAFSDDGTGWRQAAELLRGNGPVSAPERHGDPHRRHQLRPDRRHGREAGGLQRQVHLGAGLTDTWLLRNPLGPGFSCCFKQETIMDPPPGPFDHRVDHIFAKGRFKVCGRGSAHDPANRTAGLWPSDHGGGAMTLRLRASASRRAAEPASRHEGRASSRDPDRREQEEATNAITAPIATSASHLRRDDDEERDEEDADDGGLQRREAPAARGRRTSAGGRRSATPARRPRRRDRRRRCARRQLVVLQPPVGVVRLEELDRSLAVEVGGAQVVPLHDDMSP